jgi:hypothetical protein
MPILMGLKLEITNFGVNSPFAKQVTDKAINLENRNRGKRREDNKNGSWIKRQNVCSGCKQYCSNNNISFY